MKQTAGSLWLAVLLLIAVSVPVAAQQASSAPKPTRSVYDGVFTDAQAKRGDQVRVKECGMCHSPAEWSQAGFLRAWQGRTARDLFQHIRSSMPYDSPGRLTRQEYADVVAYMFSLHKLPTGSTEMKEDDDSLRQILIEVRTSPR
jgi:cytochrome c5